MIKRVFLIVMDSFGVGALPDAAKYGDEGSNTLKAVSASKYFNAKTLKSLGLFNIDGVDGSPFNLPIGSFGKMNEKSLGKDTIIGHWEITGVVFDRMLETFPNGFPEEILNEFSLKTGRGVLCNKPYSGTDVIRDYGKRHMETGELIVYTSADSVFQIAAHEGIVPIDELYRYCVIAREILDREHCVGRVIARPFCGEYPNFYRTPNRHDYAITPPQKTLLDHLSESGFDVISVGKIKDIFSSRGITEAYLSKSNFDGMSTVLSLIEKEFNGLCFVNLVEFDSVYGHRNDVDGYARAVSEFDVQLADFIAKMSDEDLLIVTADHGCDPSTSSTDHSREYVPLLVYGSTVEPGVNLGTRTSFADVAATVAEIFDLKQDYSANSFYGQIIKEKQ